MNVLITGTPGVGKTTLLEKIKKIIINKGYSVGGMCCPEILEKGKRTGFKIIDTASGREGILASIKSIKGPMIGKYHVNIEDIPDIGIMALENAIGKSDFILMDEIAPMELKSSSFRETVWKVMENRNQLLQLFISVPRILLF
jgi:nucleoside-triphosphatase